MELDSIVQFLDNKTILVIGATGFLAKIFVEKILRVQPDVKKLYLLLRAADSKSALQRLNTEVFGKDLFRVLKEKWGTNLYSQLSEKVTPVAGDITCDDNLGVKEFDLLKEIMEQVDVVVNLAATTNFDERYDFALALNTLGAKHVLNFSKKCANLKFLLHVSTAYVSGEKPGLILESPYSVGQTQNQTTGLDIDAEIQIVEQKLNELKTQNATNENITLAMKDLGIQRARKYGWPNTYVFTKAMGEMVLGDMNKKFSMAILRPTIITSTYKEPFPGWVEGVRTVDSMLVGFGKGKLTCFLGDPDSTIDCVPADMVVNAMIVAIVAHSKQPNEIIYHVGSAVSNPVKYNSIQDYAVRYFTMNPWTNKDGKQVKVSQLTVMTSMASFRRYMTLRYLFPLKVFKIVNTTLCRIFEGTYVDLNRKIKFVMRLVELYEPYLFFKGVHDDINTEKLRVAIRADSGSEKDIFYFDPKCVNWEEYFMDIHIPGLVKYIFK